MLKIPKHSNAKCDVLRLKGKGKAKSRDGGAGDELVKLKVLLPTQPDPELEAFLGSWKPAPSYDPRKEM